MATTKPTLFVVPGAWHDVSAYRKFATHLEDLGYPTVVAPLPSVDPSNPKEATCIKDGESLREQLSVLIETEAKDVVVLAHSYGGIPAASASHGLSSITRKQEGKQGGILGLVYMSAFVVPEGTSLLEYLGGKHAPYLVPNEPSEGLCTVSSPVETFYNDVDAETVPSLTAALRPQAMLAVESVTSAPAWAEDRVFDDRRLFIRSMLDQALPVFVQDMFVQRSGVQWTVKDVDAGHSAWASQTEKVAALILEFVSAL